MNDKIYMFICFIFLIALVVGLNLYVPRAGFCNSQNRYISDDELKQRVIINSIHRMKTGNAINYLRSEGNESLDFANQYIKNNPNCCIINRDYSNFFERLLGINEIKINWYFARQQTAIDKDGDGPKYKYYEKYDLVDSCGGKVLESWGGTSKGLVSFSNKFKYQNKEKNNGL